MQRAFEDWVSRNSRRHVSLATLVHRGDGSQACAHLSNLSYEGCELTCDELFLLDETIKLAVPALGSIRAEIRWVRPDLRTAGARFVHNFKAMDDAA